MMTRLVFLSDKNKILSYFIKAFVYIGTNLLSFYQEVCGFFRSKCSLFSKYANILDYKNKYFGKRCFIVCTGPSLTMEDLELLTNEITFGMNSLCLIEKQSKFRPTFYAIIDKIVFNKFNKNLLSFINDNMTVFTVERIVKNKKLFDNWKILPFNVAYHTYDRWFRHKYWCKFSDNCFRMTYDMFSVTHVLLQLAVYMGFNEIYLIGADCSFEKNKITHFIEYGTLDQDFDSAEERCLSGYIPVKEYIDMHPNIKVYNATRGGKLELFPRVKLEDVLRNEYK